MTMQSLTLLPLLVASACAGLLTTVQELHPIPQLAQAQNTATGEYGYSYSGGPSAKTEYRALDGTTTGSYSYVDANGLLQTVNYVADELGFRAAGSNLPVGLVEPTARIESHSHGTLQTLSHLRRRRSPGLLPLLQPTAALASVHHVPVATSHQSRFQIHNDAQIVTHHAVPVLASQHLLAAPVAPALHHPGALVLRKKRSPGLLYAADHHTALVAPVATAVHHLPLATSHQSRVQIHNDAHYVAHHTVPVASVDHHHLIYRKKRGLLLQAQPLAEPLFATVHHAAPAAAVVAAPAAVVHHVPVATSHQSRFQIHKSAKIVEQFHQPIYAPVVAAAATETLLPVGLHPVAPLPAKTEGVHHDSEAIAVESA